MIDARSIPNVDEAVLPLARTFDGQPKKASRKAYAHVWMVLPGCRCCSLLCSNAPPSRRACCLFASDLRGILWHPSTASARNVAGSPVARLYCINRPDAEIEHRANGNGLTACAAVPNQAVPNQAVPVRSDAG